MRQVNTRDMMAQAKFYEGYSRWDEDKQRFETWEDAVSRVMNMHRGHYEDKMTPALAEAIDFAENAYKERYILGAQRALQFGGEQLLKHEMRMYNCVSSYADRPSFFNEVFYVLLCGAGAGFSVQQHHVDKLPAISERKRQSKEYVIADSIEGWADAAAVLLSSYMVGGGVFPEYEGRKVYFNTTEIRPKNALISGGFKAPGPEPLRRALDKIEYLLQGLVLKHGTLKLRPIHVYDIIMHLADAVLAGGVRRSATLCLFSPEDEEMVMAKTGDWFQDNPQRARSNNSALLVRSTTTYERFRQLMTHVRQYGEPGFVFAESTEHCFNPCVEVGMVPRLFNEETREYESGFQGCNLAEINGSMCSSIDQLMHASKAAAIVATLQAGYTNFKYLGTASKKIFEREALLGVSITGWMNNPDVLFDEDTLTTAATLIRTVNREIAGIIGINPAARATCVKPSGNASTLLSTASGIHAEHSPKYLRHVQLNKESEVAKAIITHNPYMVEESAYSSNRTDFSVAFPVISPEGSLYRQQTTGVRLLEKVRLVQNSWVEAGTDVSLCVDPTIRHNVSNTVTVKGDEWDEVIDYVYDNRESFAGISFLPYSGDKVYFQAPFTEVYDEKQIIAEYGTGSLFASGLIVDGLKVFPHLWEAIRNGRLPQSSAVEEREGQHSWVRRFKKFAANYFEDNQQKAGDCLKDVHNLHRFTKIQNSFKAIDFPNELHQMRVTSIDTMGAQACAGGACDITGDL